MNSSLSIGQDRPFRATPDVRLYYPFSSMEAARETAVRAIVRAEGPVLVVGGAGFGKSLLAELIECEVQHRLDVVKLQSAQLCSRRALLQNILFELNLPFREMSEGELRLSILDRLEPSPETAPEGVLIVVDEAHTLHWKLIDELRLLSNFNRNNQPRVRLLLLGNMRLEDTLASPQLESLHQRLAARCYLQAMNRTETAEFVKHQLMQVGLNPSSIITQDAIGAVYSASEGIPRLANQVMDHALVLAQSLAQSPISVALVNEAWADLQQLPTPWSGTSSDALSAAEATSVEFGALADDGELPGSSTSIVWESPAQELAFDVAAVGDVPVQQIETCNSQDVCESEVREGQLQQLTLQTDDCQLNPEYSPKCHNFFSAFVCEEVGFEQVDCQTIPPSCQEVSLESIDFQVDAQQLDALDIWEDDPPLMGQSTNGKPAVTTSIQPEDLRIQPPSGEWPSEVAFAARKVESRRVGPAASSVFGDDFENEVVVPAIGRRDDGPLVELAQGALTENALTDELPTEKRLASRSSQVQLADESDQVPARTDYLQRLQQYADAIARLQQSPAEQVDQHFAEEQISVALPPDVLESQVSESQNWSWDIASSIHATRDIEGSIEEIVSQLNFSAFTSEPFSVEQIDLQVNTHPFNSHCLPPQPAQSRGQSDVFSIHQPVHSDSLSLGNLEHDDDRDLLIIEEEVPISGRLLEQSNSQEQPRTTAPYSQLFAKLRR